MRVTADRRRFLVDRALQECYEQSREDARQHEREAHVATQLHLLRLALPASSMPNVPLVELFGLRNVLCRIMQQDRCHESSIRSTTQWIAFGRR